MDPASMNDGRPRRAAGPWLSCPLAALQLGCRAWARRPSRKHAGAGTGRGGPAGGGEQSAPHPGGKDDERSCPEMLIVIGLVGKIETGFSRCGEATVLASRGLDQAAVDEVVSAGDVGGSAGGQECD